MAYTVGEVARLSRVSVRALHHYDEIGLLRPSARSPSGYRLYTDRDLERLQQILLHRELGLGLEQIGRVLDDPSFDRRKALVEQRAALSAQIERSRALLHTIDRAIRSLEGGTVMSDKDMFEGFDPAEYEDEVRARWGETEAYRQSKERTARYSKDDWAQIKAEAEAIEADFARVMAGGTTPTDEEAKAVAERHRLHIDRWFYACSKAFHACLGDMYVSDPRFAAHYDRRAAGLAAYVREAIRANAGLSP